MIESYVWKDDLHELILYEIRQNDNVVTSNHDVKFLEDDFLTFRKNSRTRSLVDALLIIDNYIELNMILDSVLRFTTFDNTHLKFDVFMSVVLTFAILLTIIIEFVLRLTSRFQSSEWLRTTSSKSLTSFIVDASLIVITNCQRDSRRFFVEFLRCCRMQIYEICFCSCLLALLDTAIIQSIHVDRLVFKRNILLICRRLSTLCVVTFTLMCIVSVNSPALSSLCSIERFQRVDESLRLSLRLRWCSEKIIHDESLLQASYRLRLDFLFLCTVNLNVRSSMRWLIVDLNVSMKKLDDSRSNSSKSNSFFLRRFSWVEAVLLSESLKKSSSCTRNRWEVKTDSFEEVIL